MTHETSLHHKAMMDGLMAEMERTAPESHKSASFMQKGWHLFDDEKKREYLRMMVDAIRESRLERKKFEQRSAAAIMSLGPEGIEQIYDAEPAEALAKARETLQEMAQAKASLALLTDMNLSATIEAAGQAASAMGADQEQAVVLFKRGHDNLRENLETVIAAGTTILLACISRAGGATLSDKEREQMRAQWDAAISTATSR
jgi:hypothetical protein